MAVIASVTAQSPAIAIADFIKRMYFSSP